MVFLKYSHVVRCSSRDVEYCLQRLLEADRFDPMIPKEFGLLVLVFLLAIPNPPNTNTKRIRNTKNARTLVNLSPIL
ncbi:hypothetical protein NQ318_005430 [Aromia moschata]|uniref:Uncharacterized protein n=1 Tax=Aromia moschata TaxID=1265417 RepID=A0AAV8YV14_9CUCU|nr:hypothetical protein NQ318_005430 [Aromia moschata]